MTVLVDAVVTKVAVTTGRVVVVVVEIVDV